MKYSINFLITLSIAVFLHSCSSIKDGDLSCFPSSSIRNHDLITKALADSLSFRITRTNIEDYLLLCEKVSPGDIQRIIRYDLSSDSYVYIVNLKAGGWYLFSGDSFCAPILAHSKEGELHFDDSLSRHEIGWIESLREYVHDNRNNPTERTMSNQKLWMHTLRMAYAKYHNRNEEPDTTDNGEENTETTYTWDTLININIPALTNTTWWPIEPFNGAIPFEHDSVRCATGCAVIAIAQLLYYTHYTFGYPNLIYGNASCNDYYYNTPYTYLFSNETSTSWDNMPLHWQDVINVPNPSVAALCALVSYISNTTYGVDTYGSYGNTLSLYIPLALGTLQLSGATQVTSFTKYDIISELNHYRPVLTSGFGSSSSSVGHMFLIEGYQWVKTQLTETVTDLEGHILEQNVSFINDIKEAINTGGSSHIQCYEGTYYSNNRSIYIGWGQN